MKLFDLSIRRQIGILLVRAFLTCELTCNKAPTVFHLTTPMTQKNRPTARQGPVRPEEAMDIIIARSSRDDFLGESYSYWQSLEEAQVTKVLEYIREHPDHTSFHLLMAMKERFPDTYANIPNERKALVLCAALMRMRDCNDWGWLAPNGSYNGKCANELIALGPSVIPGLTPILDDLTEVRFMGSMGSTLSIQYNYRRADFAFRYINLILGTEPVFFPEVAQRNKAIEDLKETINKRKEKGG